MAKLTVEIMEGDEETHLEIYFVKACGLNLMDYNNDERILTQAIFENSFGKILDIIEEHSSRRKVYIVLGYFILLTGSRLPEYLKYKIIETTRWEYEEGLWGE